MGDAAALREVAQKQARLADNLLWAREMSLLVRRCISFAGGVVPEKLSMAMQEVMTLDMERDVIERVFMDEGTIRSLHALDIDPNDHNNLAEILDHDGTGSVGIIELVDGIRRLRGEPRRSDTVTIDLKICAVQQKVDQILEEIKFNRDE